MKKVKVNLRSRLMLPNYSDAELTQLAGRVGLTLDQLKVVHSLAHQVYQEIGFDLSEANDGKPIKRADLVEIVLDANRIETMCGARLTPDLKLWFSERSHQCSLENVYGAVGAGFPYPLYE